MVKQTSLTRVSAKGNEREKSNGGEGEKGRGKAAVLECFMLKTWRNIEMGGQDPGSPEIEGVKERGN